MATARTEDPNLSQRSRPPAAARIERHTIDAVPDADRHGTARAQGPFWFASNFQFFTVAIGFIGPTMGLGVGWSALAATLGVLFGTVFMALHASQGPHLGLPQMVQSRAQFGYLGVLVPLAATLVMCTGYNIVQTKLVADGLRALLGWNRPAVAVLLGLVSFAVAAWGHDWVHRTFRVLFVAGIVVVGGLTLAVACGVVVPAPHAVVPHLGWSTVAFAAQFTAAASSNLTYAPQVSDYTRYLPARTRTAPLIASVFAGASGSAIWLMALGAWLAGRLGQSDALVALSVSGNAVFPGFGTVLVIHSVASIAAVLGLDTYSGALTLVTAEHSITGGGLSPARRIVWTAAVAVIGTALALLLPGSAVDAVDGMLTFVLYLLAPWTAVNLIDYFLIRHGDYDVAALFQPDGIYGRWNAAGLGAYAAGLLASVPFMVITPVFVGPLAAVIHGVDVAWLIGMVVSAVAYAVLTKGRKQGLLF